MGKRRFLDDVGDMLDGLVLEPAVQTTPLVLHPRPTKRRRRARGREGQSPSDFGMDLAEEGEESTNSDHDDGGGESEGESEGAEDDDLDGAFHTPGDSALMHRKFRQILEGRYEGDSMDGLFRRALASASAFVDREGERLAIVPYDPPRLVQKHKETLETGRGEEGFGGADGTVLVAKAERP